MTIEGIDRRRLKHIHFDRQAIVSQVVRKQGRQDGWLKSVGNFEGVWPLAVEDDLKFEAAWEWPLTKR